MFTLSNKIALITGASGGIGSAITELFAQQGATVCLSGTREEALEALSSHIASLGYIKPPIFPCQLTDPKACTQLMESVEKEVGALDILINNAGITRDSLLLRMKDQDFEDVIATNLTSCFRLSKMAIKSMVRRRYGRIIQITSVVGVTGNPGQTNYCASKAGMVGFSKALALEVATRGITVNCVAPGFIETKMSDAIPEDIKKKFLQAIPMNQMGCPHDVATTVLFLASQEASYITGQTLHVNGGLAMI